MLYRKKVKDRRKHQDPAYKGPERRLEKSRMRVIAQIIKNLEKELTAWKPKVLEQMVWKYYQIDPLGVLHYAAERV